MLSLVHDRRVQFDNLKSEMPCFLAVAPHKLGHFSRKDLASE